MDLSEFAEEIGDHGAVTIAGLATRGGPVDGIRPVMAPVSANSGTIDPAAVPDATWSSLCGVLTTNLYGLPDRVAELRARCDRLGIPLIEDAATHPDRGRRPAHR